MVAFFVSAREADGNCVLAYHMNSARVCFGGMPEALSFSCRHFVMFSIQQADTPRCAMIREEGGSIFGTLLIPRRAPGVGGGGCLRGVSSE